MKQQVYELIMMPTWVLRVNRYAGVFFFWYIKHMSLGINCSQGQASVQGENTSEGNGLHHASRQSPVCQQQLERQQQQPCAHDYHCPSCASCSHIGGRHDDPQRRPWWSRVLQSDHEHLHTSKWRTSLRAGGSSRCVRRRCIRFRKQATLQRPAWWWSDDARRVGALRPQRLILAHCCGQQRNAESSSVRQRSGCWRRRGAKLQRSQQGRRQQLSSELGWDGQQQGKRALCLSPAPRRPHGQQGCWLSARQLPGSGFLNLRRHSVWIWVACWKFQRSQRRRQLRRLLRRDEQHQLLKWRMNIVITRVL